VSSCDPANSPLNASTRGRTLGLQAVAEGVETAIQVDALSALGCDLAQGLYFSGPLDAPAMDVLLTTPPFNRPPRPHSPNTIVELGPPGSPSRSAELRVVRGTRAERGEMPGAASAILAIGHHRSALVLSGGMAAAGGGVTRWG
jgi:EAL domain